MLYAAGIALTRRHFPVVTFYHAVFGYFAESDFAAGSGATDHAIVHGHAMAVEVVVFKAGEPDGPATGLAAQRDAHLAVALVPGDQTVVAVPALTAGADVCAIRFDISAAQLVRDELVGVSPIPTLSSCTLMLAYRYTGRLALVTVDTVFLAEVIQVVSDCTAVVIGQVAKVRLHIGSTTDAHRYHHGQRTYQRDFACRISHYLNPPIDFHQFCHVPVGSLH